MTFPYLVAIRRKLASMKAVIFLFVCVCLFIPYPFRSYFHGQRGSGQDSALDRKERMYRWHTTAIEGFYGLRVTWPYSNLGGILFNRDETPDPNPNANRTFVVLVWKYWDWLKSRHVYNFRKSRDKVNLLEGCSVNNCVFSGNDSYMDTADAVLIHLQRGVIPQVKNRNRTQRWIFLNDESPINAFSLATNKPTLDRLYDVFNWSMTYRSDADVPVPYGRVLPRKKPIKPGYKSLQDIADIVPYWERKRRGRTAAVLMSNCGVKARNEFLRKLKKYVQVDVFGGCADIDEFKESCPEHFRADCEPITEYIFYLVLENSSCYQYLTEKVFFNAFSKGAIPVIFGPALDDVETLLPPNSYLFADEETDIKLLANDINSVAKSQELILEMHMWRNHFKIVNEHGYFGTKSYHLCRVCEALNYNDPKEKVYKKELLDSFLDPKKVCDNRLPIDRFLYKGLN